MDIDRPEPGALVVRRLRDMPSLPRWSPKLVVQQYELSRRGAGVDLEEETRCLALLDHPEFYLLWDRAADLPSDFLVGGVNPRLHVALHQVVESQLIQNDPPEVAKAVEHLLELGVDRHRTLHLILEGLVEGFHAVSAERRPWDAARYRRHLEQLTRAIVANDDGVAPPARGRPPGRNDPCPCGSGKKYKRCCGPNGAPPRRLTPESGRMILGAGFCATYGYLRRARDGDPLLYVENLAAVAHTLEQEGIPDVAIEAYRRLVAAADQSGREGCLANALQELEGFALNHPKYAADGIQAVQRRIERAADACEIAQLRLDLAELYDMAGQPGRAESLFREVMADDPPEPYCHLRWARRLAGAGSPAEAESVYRRVIERNGMGDAWAVTEALDELADLLDEQGRQAEAAALRERGREQ